MSHPERLGASGGGQVSAIAEPPQPNGDNALVRLATGHGLKQSAARPPLRVYVRQLWQRRHFIWAFASAKAFSTYTGSRLGQLWQVLTPLLNAAVYYLIFGVLMGTNRGVDNFIPFLVTGVFVFSFTQRSVTSGAKSVGTNLSLIRALHFPRASLPFAYTIVELQQLLASLVVLCVIILATGEPVAWSWLFLAPALCLQIVFNIGLSMVVARIGAFVRDIQQLLPFILRTWLYTSGIMFAIPVMAERLLGKHPGATWVQPVMEANPGSVYVELARLSLIKSYKGDYAAYHEGMATLWWWGLTWAIVMFVGGFWFFYRAEERYGRG